MRPGQEILRLALPALSETVLVLNVLGDFLRDFLDPRLRPFLLYSFSASSKGRT